MKNIAIIPARSGSKGLKDKNIKLLNGKPLMWYSIDAAIKSRQFEEIMVSTDSEEYATIAKSLGANVPFLRSKMTSHDNASSWDVVSEVLRKYNALGMQYDTVMLLQPTSPLRSSSDIINSFKLLEQKKADSIVSVCEVDHSPLWSNTLPNDRNMGTFIRPEIKENTIRQKLPVYFRLNGAIYLSKIDYSSMSFTLYNEKCFAYEMSQEKSIDIDTSLDFMFAEFLMNK